MPFRESSSVQSSTASHAPLSALATRKGTSISPFLRRAAADQETRTLSPTLSQSRYNFLNEFRTPRFRLSTVSTRSENGLVSRLEESCKLGVLVANIQFQLVEETPVGKKLDSAGQETETLSQTNKSP